MKAFKFDFDGTKFVKISFDVAHKYDFSNELDTLLADTRTHHNCCEASVDRSVASLNSSLCKEFTGDNKLTDIIVRRCKDCGKYFILSYEEYLWFTRRGLKTPAHCNLCRGKKRSRR